MVIRVDSLTGDAARAVFDDLARLRISVFRAFPYLYDGDLDYERDYLATYANSKDGVVVTAFDDDTVIGAATALPLADETEEVIAPFRDKGFDLSSVFYFGESVLDSRYRGQGIGHAFFDQREAHARSLGYTWTAFCAVVRPINHPRRPEDYAPLDPFWEKRGYQRRDDMVTTFTWQDLDEDRKSPKPLRFWLRNVTDGA